MNWDEQLQPQERILWQGRPAPRCYTFRHWKLAGIGLLLFLTCSFWQMLGLQLVADGYPWYLGLVPAPLVVGAFLLGPGQVLFARWQWERIFYCLTDSRLLCCTGLWRARVIAVSLADLKDSQQRRHGEQLASIRLRRRDGGFVILHCLEQPQQLLSILVAQGVPASRGKSV